MKPITATSTCLLAGAVSAYCLWRWYLRKFSYLTFIRGERQMIAQSLLRAYFECHLSNIQDLLGPTVDKCYMRIAAERRILEDLVYEIFRHLNLRFRDVGGSQIRPESFNHLKHLCSPPRDGETGVYMKREGVSKERQTFLTCSDFGQCPYKDAFPGLLLSYADYYIDREQLAELVKSHTFILTQRFDSFAGSFHGEQNWTKVDDKIILVLPDGKVHCHPWNEWQSEGVVVGRKGAFKYFLVYSGPTSNLYYAYPEPGIYNGADPKCLRRSTEVSTEIQMLSGYRAVLRVDRVKILDQQRRLVFDYDRDLLDACVIKFGPRKQRDETFLEEVRSFLLTRSRQSWISISEDSAPLVLELVLAMCNRYAFNLTAGTFYGYDMLNLSLLTKVKHCLWKLAKRNRQSSPNLVSMPRYVKTNADFLREIERTRKTIKSNEYPDERWQLESLKNADFSPLIATDKVRGEKFIYSPLFGLDPLHCKREDAKYISIGDFDGITTMSAMMYKRGGREILRNYLESFLEYFVKRNKSMAAMNNNYSSIYCC